MNFLLGLQAPWGEGCMASSIAEIITKSQAAEARILFSWYWWRRFGGSCPFSHKYVWPFWPERILSIPSSSLQSPQEMWTLTTALWKMGNKQSGYWPSFHFISSLTKKICFRFLFVFFFFNLNWKLRFSFRLLNHKFSVRWAKNTFTHLSYLLAILSFHRITE